MRSDQSSATADATSRRRFLTRTAAGGAIAAVGASALPIGNLLGVAGAQEETTTTTTTVADLDLSTDAGFAAFAAPLEWVAVQAYQAALDKQLLDTEWTERARLFRDHHQAVVDALTTLLGDGAEEPTPNAELLAQTTTAIEGASDVTAIYTALAELEDTLAATHLSATATLTDGVTVKLVGQVLAVENQQAVLLSIAAGSSIDEVTPAETTTEDALEPGEGVLADASDAADDSTTTTTAGN